MATDNKHLSSFLKLIFGMTTFQLLKRKLQLNCKRKVIKLCFDKNYAHLISVIFLILLVTLGEKDLFCLKNLCIWTIFDNCLFYRIVFNVKYHFVEHLSNLLLNNGSLPTSDLSFRTAVFNGHSLNLYSCFESEESYLDTVTELPHPLS